MRILSSVPSSLFSELCVRFRFAAARRAPSSRSGTIAWADRHPRRHVHRPPGRDLGTSMVRPTPGSAVLPVALASIQNMAVQRVHDAGYSYWSGFRRFRDGQARHGRNPTRMDRRRRAAACGDFLPSWCSWSTAGIAASSLVIERYAAALCAPTVSVSAANERRGPDALERSRPVETRRQTISPAVRSGHTMACRNGECTVSGRACRRP